MGTKKHKKESKKKKHRSRSRSPLDGEERERKRHKKHKDRKKNRSPDVEEVPVDSHLPQYQDKNGAQRSRSRSSSEELPPPPAHPAPPPPPALAPADRERDRDREKRHRHRDREEATYSSRSESRERSPSRAGGGDAGAGGAAQESLSIEETNRLRAKLGLKPLQVSEAPAEDGKIKDDLGEFYHKPAANIAEQKKSEKIRERLEERRERRKIEQKLQVRTLGEGSGSDDEDATAWVIKSRENDKLRQEAAKKAAMLDEMDVAFGVSALVEQDAREERAHSYSARALTGLRVAHDVTTLAEERETILTLADKDVLAEDAEDVLVNVNMLDDERHKKRVEEARKARAGYQAYDEEAEVQAALGLPRAVLSKYDDDDDARDRGFVIGDHAGLEARRFRDMMRQERLAGGPDKRLESLRLPELRVASEYLDHHEMEAKFKKPRKRGKMRKKAKEEPIDVDDYDAGAAPLLTDDTEVGADVLSAAGGALVVDEDEVEPDGELQQALARARRMRAVQNMGAHVPKIEEILEQVKQEPMKTEDSDSGGEGGGGGGGGGADAGEGAGGAMVLDATAEFCRTLGDIPTYGLAGNRDQRQEILDFERDMEVETEAEAEGAGAAGAWSRVDIHNEKPPDLVAGSSVGLEAEPALGAGVAGALQLALSKGYLERAGAGGPQPRPISSHALAARHYSIEDKTQGEDDKYGRRERGYGGGGGGPLVEFREKAGFRPNIKLEYVDDDGRALCPKEAFRYLSHKFHGKGPGKNKQEKRIKKQIQEGLMKKMSSTDTPLNTLQMLQEKQRETHSPYIVLSGQKRDTNN